MTTIYSLFKQQVDLRPDAPAIIQSGRTITYAQLSRMADAIAAGFPVDRPRFVGVVLPSSPERVAAMLAVLKMGAAYVPVEPSFPADRIKFVMGEAKADFVITHGPAVRKMRGLLLDVVKMPLAAPTAVPDNANVDLSTPDGPAYVLYTSGSTGMPKGVTVLNRNVTSYVRAFQHEFHPAPGDVMLQYSVCSFDIYVEEVFTTLLSGAALAIPTPEERADVAALMAFVTRHGVTIIDGFPYLLQDINRHGFMPPSVRLYISGGDVLRPSYVDKIIAHAPVYNTYGPSETTVCATYFRCRPEDALPDNTFPIGRPVLGAEVRLLKPGTDQEAAPGEPGEICILGPGVSAGYLGDRAVENRAFVALPDGRRMYRSGDLGLMMSDGNLRFLHRIDTQVMILGKRVETCEVESAMTRCPGIKNAVVRACTDTKGLAYLTAYFVAKRAGRFSIHALKRSLRRFLPPYMMPEFFVCLEAMPLTANGKVDFSHLPIVMKDE